MYFLWLFKPFAGFSSSVEFQARLMVSDTHRYTTTKRKTLFILTCDDNSSDDDLPSEGMRQVLYGFSNK